MQATRDFSYYVKDAGAGHSHIDLAVEGVSCAGCMSKIERGLSAIPDVTLGSRQSDRPPGGAGMAGERSIRPDSSTGSLNSDTRPIRLKRKARRLRRPSNRASCCDALASRHSRQ